MPTDKQNLYIKHRVAGHRPAQAARMAGYAAKSASIQAAKNERNPKIRAAIDEQAPPPPPPEPVRSVAYTSAESYLQAVVEGREPPDPLRVAAARCLIAYESPRQRRPLPAELSPKKDAELQRIADQRSAEAEWARKMESIKRRYEK